MNAADRFEGLQEKKLNLVLHWIDAGEVKVRVCGGGRGVSHRKIPGFYTEFLEVC